MSIRAKNAHFTNWAKVVEALSSYGITDEASARAFLALAKPGGVDNPFYYMVSFIKDTKEIYTHGQFYECGIQNVSNVTDTKHLFGSSLDIEPEEGVILFDSEDATIKLGVVDEYGAGVIWKPYCGIEKEIPLLSIIDHTATDSNVQIYGLDQHEGQLTSTTIAPATATTAGVMSAAQAKKLNNLPESTYSTEYINTNIISRLNTLTNNTSAVFKFKGSVYGTEELPQEGNSIGDVYYVTSNGSEYVWISESANEYGGFGEDFNYGWLELGPIVSGYAKESDLQKLAEEVAENELVASAALTALEDNKADKSEIAEKQDTLVSGTTIKTINGQDILGSGDIVIESLTESDIAAMGFTKNTGTYSKPSAGIPKSDLASDIQSSLTKADNALPKDGKATSATTADTATTATNLASAPSLSANGNAIKVTAGGKTSSDFTVPFATRTTYASCDSEGYGIKDTYSKKADLSAVATSGSYTDLTNKPDFKGTYYIEDISLWDLESLDARVQLDKQGIINAVKEGKVIIIPYDKENLSMGGHVADVYDDDYLYIQLWAYGKLYSIETTRSDDDLLPEEIFKYEYQPQLISGTNIKTINGTSILGSGNITIESNSGNSNANVAAVDTNDVIDDVNVSYATVSYVNNLVGDINSVLESIINGGNAVDSIYPINLSLGDNGEYGVEIYNYFANLFGWDADSGTVNVSTYTLNADEEVIVNGYNMTTVKATVMTAPTGSKMLNIDFEPLPAGYALVFLNSSGVVNMPSGPSLPF